MVKLIKFCLPGPEPGLGTTLAVTHAIHPVRGNQSLGLIYSFVICLWLASPTKLESVWPKGGIQRHTLPAKEVYICEEVSMWPLKLDKKVSNIGIRRHNCYYSNLHVYTDYIKNWKRIGMYLEVLRNETSITRQKWRFMIELRFLKNYCNNFFNAVVLATTSIIVTD